MAIIPTVRCKRMETSLVFYTSVLDFQCVEHGGYDDPTVSVLMRSGALLLLSSHGW
jgi:catechol 2,3-dioxygenase-like lactoylglutathione lyase family enzyme